MQKRKKEVSHMDEAIAQRCIAEARYMLRHRTTIRQTAAAFQLSKSGIHKDMLQHLPQADAALAREVSALLAYNKFVPFARRRSDTAALCTGKKPKICGVLAIS